MAFLDNSQRAFLAGISRLDYCNPFIPDRIKFEREVLGEAFVEADAVWSVRPDLEGERANIRCLIDQVEAMARNLRAKLARGAKANPSELSLYEDLVLYALYHRFRQDLAEVIDKSMSGQSGSPAPVNRYRKFVSDFEHFLRLPGVSFPSDHDPAHIFALFFQIRRAFHHIFQFIVGGSMPAARLRASVWQSIFTHDMRRYRRLLYDRMGDITTLITGPSGTGKELVARAIGLSRYTPFDPRTHKFIEDFAGSFQALNLSALSPTLIESELFGHKRGAFTGALADRAGWLEQCRPLGTVFLDEIGDLDVSIQVKLLRVLQTRTFQSLGDTRTKQFHGKIMAATNRDLTAQMKSGEFREDFYYRLCSDLIVTPSLHEQIADAHQDLRSLILFIARRVTPQEAETLADEVETWIDQQLGRDYRWPGNIRELEQCVRNVLIRKEYHPPARTLDAESGGPLDALSAEIHGAKISADELLSRYCTLVYARTGSYEASARQLGLDRRTVKAKIDPAWLEKFRRDS